MRPWTVICIEGNTTKMIEVTAPFDSPAAYSYISKQMHGSDIIALIPGNYAGRCDIFNRARRAP